MSKRTKPAQIGDLLAMFDSDNLDERVTAIEALGEIGDARALRLLRERLALVGKEHYVLIVAVGKLKRRLGVK
jgi:HEAT repeat protein